MSEPVSEATGREAIARVAEGIRETQIAAGVPIPDGGVDWARQVVTDQIRKHEARVNVLPEAAATDDEHPCRINRGDVGENSEVIDRDMSASARGRRHLRDTRSLEILMLEGRLELIRYFPCEPGCVEPGHVHAWNEKLIKAVDDAVVWTRKSGWTDDDPRTTARLCDAMMKVVELSGAPLEMGGLGLGDYRTLRQEVYVRLPKRGGLVPMSQLPKHAAPQLIAVDAREKS